VTDVGHHLAQLRLADAEMARPITQLARKALKRSRGRRRRAAEPILSPLRTLIEELRTRPRAPGVDTLLVNSWGRPWGRPWSADALGKRFGEDRTHAGIVHRESGEPDRPKHLHDVRGTYVTHLCRAGLTDREIADITRLERAECHAHPPHVR